jgi:hypothetical protein
VWLREHRHELFDADFQAELAGMYQDKPVGQPPVPPAQLGLATILQADTGASDDRVLRRRGPLLQARRFMRCHDGDQELSTLRQRLRARRHVLDHIVEELIEQLVGHLLRVRRRTEVLMKDPIELIDPHGRLRDQRVELVTGIAPCQRGKDGDDRPCQTATHRPDVHGDAP